MVIFNRSTNGGQEVTSRSRHWKEKDVCGGVGSGGVAEKDGLLGESLGMSLLGMNMS